MGWKMELQLLHLVENFEEKKKEVRRPDKTAAGRMKGTGTGGSVKPRMCKRKEREREREKKKKKHLYKYEGYLNDEVQ